MSGTRYVTPNQFAVAATGAPLVGGLLYFYETGTNTPQNTYQDVGLTTPNPNPIPADSAGQFGNIFLLTSPAYRVTLTDAAGVQMWTMDPVGPGVGNSGGGTVPIGTMLAWGGAESSVPSGYLICGGQAVSRTTFAGLFAVIGTFYGTGDGSTTFNVPDKRGRVSIGKDDMGGVAANRVTSGGSGINGVTLGATGGSQSVQTHTHSITDPGHTHSLTDPGHNHPVTTSSNVGVGTFVTGNSSGSPALNGGPTQNASTGISISTDETGVSVGNFGAGSSQNMPPGQIDNWIIRAS